MAAPTFDSTRGVWERADTLQTVVVDIASAAADADGRYVLFRPEAAGKVVNARAHPKQTLAAGTANYASVAVQNGGQSGAGTATTVISAAVGGTAEGGTAPGWTANTAVDLPVTGTATFVADDAIVAVVDENGSFAVDFAIEISYRLNV